MWDFSLAEKLFIKFAREAQIRNFYENFKEYSQYFLPWEVPSLDQPGHERLQAAEGELRRLLQVLQWLAGLVAEELRDGSCEL